MNQKRSLMKKRKVITDDDDDSIDLNLDLPAQQNGVGSSFKPAFCKRLEEFLRFTLVESSIDEATPKLAKVILSEFPDFTTRKEMLDYYSVVVNSRRSNERGHAHKISTKRERIEGDQLFSSSISNIEIGIMSRSSEDLNIIRMMASYLMELVYHAENYSPDFHPVFMTDVTILQALVLSCDVATPPSIRKVKTMMARDADLELEVPILPPVSATIQAPPKPAQSALSRVVNIFALLK
jgi:hypothetical protein